MSQDWLWIMVVTLWGCRSSGVGELAAGATTAFFDVRGERIIEAKESWRPRLMVFEDRILALNV